MICPKIITIPPKTTNSLCFEKINVSIILVNNITTAIPNVNFTILLVCLVTIFMAIPTIVVGFYGMNIILPFQNDPDAFIIVSGITVIIMLCFVIFFQRKKWL